MTEQIKRDEHIRLVDGHSAILSAVRLSEEVFEVMLLLNGGEGEEITSCQCTSTEGALYCFEEIKTQYHVPELSGQYKKLADDLKSALAYGQECKGTDDGGPSNFDAPAICLPGWDKPLIEAAVKTAGLRFFEWEFGGAKYYVLPVPGVGQGLTRTCVSEAMSQYLMGQGYDTVMYYQMD